MRKLITAPVTGQTVKMIGRLLSVLVDTGVVSQPEYNEVMSNLRHLAQKGEMLPNVIPQLVDQKEAAEMLGISFPHFRNLERAGYFSFKRRMVGTAVRYRNTDIVNYILALPEIAPEGLEEEKRPDEALPARA